MTERRISLTQLVMQQIRERRVQKGWSLQALAEAAGLHRTFIGLLERGKRGLTLEAAARLAEALDLRLGDLVAEAERRLESEININGGDNHE